MTSYKSLSGELADLMRAADLDDGDMRPAARVRRSTISDIPSMYKSSAEANVSQSYFGGSVTSSSTSSGTASYHRLSCTLTETDDYGFPLPSRMSLDSYKSQMEALRAKLGRQQIRWSALYRGSGYFASSIGSHQAKKAIRKGIPADLRPEAWLFYSGARELEVWRRKDLYGELARKSQPSRMFELEVGQTFVSNIHFGTLLVQSGVEQNGSVYARHALPRILLAYAHYHELNSVPGSMNVIASALLLATKCEHTTFCLLVAHTRLSESPSYSSAKGRACEIEQEVLMSLLEQKQPKLYKHLRSSGIDNLQNLCSTWISSLFIENLPFDTVLRVLDTYLHEGPKILLRIGLALFQIYSDHLRSIKDPHELRKAIKELPTNVFDQTCLMDMAFEGIGGMSADMIKKIRQKAAAKWDSVPRIGHTDGSLPIHQSEDEEPVLNSEIAVTPIVIPSTLHPQPRMLSLASPEWTLSVSPPRGGRKTHLSPAILSTLTEETSDAEAEV